MSIEHVLPMKEKPGAETPWLKINQLLTSEERFAIQLPHWQGFLLAPRHSSQLAALLYFLKQSDIPFCVQGKGHEALPKPRDALIVSARAFSHIHWHAHGVVEVGAGCSLSLLDQFLFEKKQEVALEESCVASSKRSVAALILSGKAAGFRYQESFPETILGVEFVSWEGSQVKWGGKYRSAGGGPCLHRLIWGLEALPGVITKILLKTYPIPPKRLQLAWRFRQREALWQQWRELKQFTSSWEYLDVVLAGESSLQGFIFAQISGLTEEMEAFSLVCPGYERASQQVERSKVKHFLKQQQLNAIRVDKHYPLKSRDYLWQQEGDPEAWLFTPQPSDSSASHFPTWKSRLEESLRR